MQRFTGDHWGRSCVRGPVGAPGRPAPTDAIHAYHAPWCPRCRAEYDAGWPLVRAAAARAGLSFLTTDVSGLPAARLTALGVAVVPTYVFRGRHYLAHERPALLAAIAARGGGSADHAPVRV